MSGRIRSIKPEWLEDELLAFASLGARVASVGLMLLADDYGNGRANVAWLRGQLFPGDETSGPTEAALGELERMRFVVLYTVAGQSYFSIRNWDKHQRVDKPGKPRVPATPENIPGSLAKIPGSLATDHDHDHDREPNQRGRKRPSAPEGTQTPGGPTEATETAVRSAADAAPSEFQGAQATTPADGLENAPVGQLEAKPKTRAKRSTGKTTLPKRWRRVPDTWESNAQHAEMAAALRLDLTTELRRFRDYEFRTPRSDPDSTFRNWLERAAEFRAPARSCSVSAGGPGANVNDLFDRAARLRLAGE